MISCLDFKVDDSSKEPKCKQLEEFLLDVIREKKILVGAKLPSVSQANKHFGVSRDTVLAAYGALQQRGVVVSRPGKGFYVASRRTKTVLKILLLFDAMNQCKETLYRSLVQHLGRNYEIDIAFHYYNEKLFRSLIENNRSEYGYFVLMPHFNVDVTDAIRLLPSSRVLLLDAFPQGLGVEYAAVYQDFAEDVYVGLRSLLDKLRTYESLDVVYNGQFQFIPDSLVAGMRRFSEDFKIPLHIYRGFDFSKIEKGKCYMAISDRDLAGVIKAMWEKKFEIGRDMGLLSFDDTPLKEVLLGGVTTITTDFEWMGEQAASLIKRRKIKQIHNLSRVMLRNTI